VEHRPLDAQGNVGYLKISKGAPGELYTFTYTYYAYYEVGSKGFFEGLGDFFTSPIGIATLAVGAITAGAAWAASAGVFAGEAGLSAGAGGLALGEVTALTAGGVALESGAALGAGGLALDFGAGTALTAGGVALESGAALGAGGVALDFGAGTALTAGLLEGQAILGGAAADSWWVSGLQTIANNQAAIRASSSVIQQGVKLAGGSSAASSKALPVSLLSPSRPLIVPPLPGRKSVPGTQLPSGPDTLDAAKQGAKKLAETITNNPILFLALGVAGGLGLAVAVRR
jgi:hypothetical protein